MILPHNRHMSFSLYISVLAVSDTMTLAIGKFFKDISEDMSSFCMASDTYVLDTFCDGYPGFKAKLGLLAKPR